MAGYVATIGTFDGVHRGHQFVLQQTVDEARRRGLQAMAITFDRLKPDTLSPLESKQALLTQTGLDRIVVLPFNEELKQMTARQFMEQVLKMQLNVQILITGYDNRFGHNRLEGFDDYVRYGQEIGMEVKRLPPAPSKKSESHVSSSIIRELLHEGNVSEANEALGHPYAISGHVEHGEHIGTSLGFPTANVAADHKQQLIPAAGAYAVKVRLEQDTEWKAGMMNIGTRPTFEGQCQTLEVNIFNLNEDLYGKQLTVAFVERLRREQRFDSIEALKEQLQQDAIAAKSILA